MSIMIESALILLFDGIGFAETHGSALFLVLEIVFRRTDFKRGKLKMIRKVLIKYTYLSIANIKTTLIVKDSPKP